MSMRVEAAVVVAVCVVLVLVLFHPRAVSLRVFHAGSLSKPFEEIEKEFEAEHPDVDVQLESMGSVTAIRQITEVGKRADVLASADCSLIEDMMYPEYADWYVIFAGNEMVIAYTEKSRYSDEINASNFCDILRRDGVIFGFSDPNTDPCGYRALMVMQLAELHYNDSSIFDDLVVRNTAITIREENNTFLINVPEELNPNTKKVKIRDKSVALISMLELGGIDYAFEYRSVAVQHGLKFLDLPPQIDLGRMEYAEDYGRVKVKTADGRIKTGKPIVYGITVPKNAENPDIGIEFIRFVTGDLGQRIFDDNGQPAIVPPVGAGDLPEELGIMKAKEL